METAKETCVFISACSVCKCIICGQSYKQCRPWGVANSRLVSQLPLGASPISFWCVGRRFSVKMRAMQVTLRALRLLGNICIKHVLFELSVATGKLTISSNYAVQSPTEYRHYHYLTQWQILPGCICALLPLTSSPSHWGMYVRRYKFTYIKT